MIIYDLVLEILGLPAALLLVNSIPRCILLGWLG